MDSLFEKVAEFSGSCLKQDKAAFTHRNEVNFFIVYELDTGSRDLNTKFTLDDCMFGAVNADLRMLILINMDIVVMVLDLMNAHNLR